MVGFIGFVVVFYAYCAAWTIHGWLDRNVNARYARQSRLVAGFVASSSILIFSYIVQISIAAEDYKDRAEHWRSIALSK